MGEVLIQNGVDEASGLAYRVTGDPGGVPLVYVPGVHGDWTPQAKAQPSLAESTRLVEMTYPREPHWTMKDYTAAVIGLMDRLDLESAHIAAESFGSLVGWEMAANHAERVRSLVIVAGFCETPGPDKVQMARWGLTLLPTWLFEAGVDAYVAVRRHQGRIHPSMEVDLPPYSSVRSHDGRLATIRRFELIAEADYRHLLGDLSLPVRYIGGDEDLIVPVKREIRTLELMLSPESRFESHVIEGGPHMIIQSHAEETAGRIVEWVLDAEAGDSG